MCVIAAIPSDAILSKTRAERLWDRNSDGGGFAYIGSDEQLMVGKYLTEKSFMEQYFKAKEENPHTPFLVHMRIATHGDVTVENIHPFRVDDHTVMAHNGILSKLTMRSDKDRSDTRVLVEEVLPLMPENWLDNVLMRELVESWIGVGNKLVFLTTNPNLKDNLYILNAKAGTKKDGMWFSNNFGLDEPPKLKPYTQKPIQHKVYCFYCGNPKPDHSPFFCREKPTNVAEQAEMQDAWRNKKEEERQIKKAAQLHLWTDQEKIAMRLELEDIREDKGNWQAVIAVEDTTKGTVSYMCTRCYETVDLTTRGTCLCWTKIDTNCESFLAHCWCQDSEATVMDFKDLTGPKHEELKTAVVVNAQAMVSILNGTK